MQSSSKIEERGDSKLNTRRDAILEGAKAASRLHKELKSRDRAESGEISRIDVIGTIVEMEVALLFRPLEGLLGFFLPGPEPGVVVSTQRPLRVQRFTAAHELGHFVQEHEASLDTPDVILRAGYESRNLHLVEIAANSFAGEFLVPRWLLTMHARRRAWNKNSLTVAKNVYQLALRLGVSYEATCRTLYRYRLINRAAMNNLLRVQPKTIKQGILGDVSIENWHPDVWVLDAADQDAVIEGGPNDVFVFELREKGAAGYLWSLNDVRESGFAIVKDERDIARSGHNPGGDVSRHIVAQHSSGAAGDLMWEHRQPWASGSKSLDELRYSYDLQGREEGRPRILRDGLKAA